MKKAYQKNSRRTLGWKCVLAIMTSLIMVATYSVDILSIYAEDGIDSSQTQQEQVQIDENGGVTEQTDSQASESEEVKEAPKASAKEGQEEDSAQDKSNEPAKEEKASPASADKGEDSSIKTQATEPNLTGTLQTAWLGLVDAWSKSPVYGSSTESSPNYLKTDIDYPNAAVNSYIYVRIMGEYENLSPNTTYQATLTIIYPNGDREEYDVEPITTEESGKGTYTVTQNYKHYTGENGRYGVELKLTSGDEEVTWGGNPDENQYAFIVGGFYGINGSYVTVPEGLSIYNRYLQFVTPEDGKNGVTFNREVTLVGLKPNTDYVIYDWVCKRDPSWNSQGNIEHASYEFTSDADGNATIKYTMGTYGDLEQGYYYQVYSAVHQKGTPSYFRYDYNYDLPTSNTCVVVMKEDNQPTEDTTYVDVTIEALDEDTKGSLAGAKLRIVKGADETGETVEEWTSDGSPKTFSLPEGTYTLVQDSAPAGYIKSESKTFEVTGDKAMVHGYSYSAYTNYVTVKNDYQFYEMMFHPYYDIMNAGLGYCINLGMADPSPLDQYNLDRLFYRETLVESDELLNAVNNKDLTAEELNYQIKRVIYNGYPTDASGIKGKYGLDDEEFRFITQMAVHHYSDGRQWESEYLAGDKDYVAAYEELIACDNPPPEDMILRVYIAENDRYQSLVASEFTSDLGLSLQIFNTKEKDEEEPNKEEPNKPEEKEETKKPNLTVEKTTTASDVTVGDKIDYTITVKNTGDATAKDCTIQDILGAGLAYAKDDSDGINSQQITTWKRDIAPGEAVEIHLSAEVLQEARNLEELTNTASVLGEGMEVMAGDSATVTFDSGKDIIIEQPGPREMTGFTTAHTTKKQPVARRVVRTGDNIPLVGLALLCAVAMATALLTRRRHNRTI